VPGTPGNVVSVPTSGTRIVTTWSDNSSVETGYQVERRVYTGAAWGSWEAMGSVAANITTFANPGLVPGVMYQYRVRACGLVGCSPMVSASPVTAPTPPAAPAAAAAEAVTATRIRVTWTDGITTETAFSLSRRVSVGGVWGVWEEITQPAANTVEYLDTGLTIGQGYQYRVRACNPGGCSGWTTATPVTIPLIPTAPSGLTAMAFEDSSVELAWTDGSTNETGFEIWMRTYAGGTWSAWAQEGAPAPANAVAYGVGIMDTGGTYQFRIRACNTTGCSAFTSSVTVRTPAS
jgi:hypothetical protein